VVFFGKPNFGIWDSTTTGILRTALAEATRRALAGGIYSDKDGTPTHDALAKAISDLAQKGERDHQRLVQAALKRLGASQHG
jgi:hypothetical protein